METFEQDSFPAQIKQIQRSLKPYVRERQEVIRVRKVLATHLSSQLEFHERVISPPLSLLSGEAVSETPPVGLRGIRKEYIRCLQANTKARREYESIIGQHRSQVNNDKLSSYVSQGCEDAGAGLNSFLDVIRSRRKHERLRVIQDYIDKLASRPAAATNHLDLNTVLKNIDPLPKVPQEVMNASEPSNESDSTDLRSLVDQLEKAVLRAKLLLKKEQNLLVKVKNGEVTASRSPSDRYGSRLEALGTARNELINWIETELANAGESSAEVDEDQDTNVLEKKGKDYMESQLTSIQRRYMEYTKIRQNLIQVATRGPEPVSSVVSNTEIEHSDAKETFTQPTAACYIAYPYLQELAIISNEQKSIIQQKSHLSVSLAKQVKDSSQGLDRLVEESHLLPAHPMPSNISKRRSPASFADEISNFEKPNSSRRAQAWVFASEASSSATRDAILMTLEEGEKSTSNARRLLAELHELLGEGSNETLDGNADDITKGRSGDIWSQIDGQLGAIKTDEIS